MMDLFKQRLLGKAQVGQDLGQAKQEAAKKQEVDVLDRYKPTESLVSKAINMFREGAKKK
jgi:hypothetical protein